MSVFVISKGVEVYLHLVQDKTNAFRLMGKQVYGRVLGAS